MAASDGDKIMAAKTEIIIVTESSRNVFSGLGCNNQKGLKVKAEIAAVVNPIVKHRNITQTEAAEVLEISQPQVSNQKRGNLKHFSAERLFGFLNALDQDVEIRIKKKSPRTWKEAHVVVVAT